MSTTVVSCVVLSAHALVSQQEELLSSVSVVLRHRCVPSAEGLNPVNLSWILELVLFGAWFSNGGAFRGDVWWAGAGSGPWEVGGFRPPIRLLSLRRPSPALSFSVHPGLLLVSGFLVASSGWGNIKRLRRGGLRFKVRLSMVLLRMLLHPGFRCWVCARQF